MAGLVLPTAADITLLPSTCYLPRVFGFTSRRQVHAIESDRRSAIRAGLISSTREFRAGQVVALR
jgi:hypothetical protein